MTKSRINWTSGISLQKYDFMFVFSKDGPIPEQHVACQQGKPCDSHQGIGNVSTTGTTKLTSNMHYVITIPRNSLERKEKGKLWIILSVKAL